MSELIGSRVDLSSHRLDIVRDNHELSGRFPQNVELGFVYHDHGAKNDWATARGLEIAEKAAPFLIDSDVVAIETPVIPKPFDANEEADFVNLHNTDGIVDLRAAFERSINLDGEERTTLPIKLIALTEAMKKLGASIPKFVPVDVWADRSAGWPRLIRDIREDAEYNTSLDRYRESTTLKQLHRVAVDLASDGQQHKIAVLYGSNHTYLSVAARILGAPTSRVFVDDPMIKNTRAALARVIRYTPEEERDQIPYDEYALAENINLGVENLVLNTSKKLAKSDVGERVRSKIEELEIGLGFIMLRAIQDKLTSTKQKEFEENFAVISPYLVGMRKPGFRSNKKLVRTLSKLLDLSES